MASDLVQRNVDLIVAGTTGASIAAKNATPTIPIVMAASGLGDPVELGLVQSLARPVLRAYSTHSLIRNASHGSFARRLRC